MYFLMIFCQAYGLNGFSMMAGGWIGAVSKSQIRFAGKAPFDENAQSRPRRDEPVMEIGNAAWKPLMGF
jgi:hypothetical protein